MTREEILRSMECVLESDKRAIKNPISEYGWLFDKIYEWKKSLDQEPCKNAISRQAVIEVLNNMDRYVADELTLCDTEKKFPKNEVFIVDDVYEEIVEQLPSVTPQHCEDCISRQAVLDVIKSMSNANPSYWNKCDVVDRENLLDEIAQMPPVTPHPKMGKWIIKSDSEEFAKWTECSECGYKHNCITYKDKFCSNCGVKMEVSENG